MDQPNRKVPELHARGRLRIRIHNQSLLRAFLHPILSASAGPSFLSGTAPMLHAIIGVARDGMPPPGGSFPALEDHADLLQVEVAFEIVHHLVLDLAGAMLPDQLGAPGRDDGEHEVEMGPQV